MSSVDLSLLAGLSNVITKANTSGMPSTVYVNNKHPQSVTNATVTGQSTQVFNPAGTQVTDSRTRELERILIQTREHVINNVTKCPYWNRVQPYIDEACRDHFLSEYKLDDEEVINLLQRFRKEVCPILAAQYVEALEYPEAGFGDPTLPERIITRARELQPEPWPCLIRAIAKIVTQKIMEWTAQNTLSQNSKLPEPERAKSMPPPPDDHSSSLNGVAKQFRLGRLGDYPSIDPTDSQESYDEIMNGCIDFESFNPVIQKYTLKWSTKYSQDTVENAITQITEQAGMVISERYWSTHRDSILAEAAKKGATFVANYLDRLRKRNWPLSWRKSFKIYIEHGVRQMRSVTANIDDSNKYGLLTEELDWFPVLKSGLPEVMGRKFAELDAIWATWDTRGKSMYKYNEDSKLWEEKNIDDLRTYISDHFAGLITSMSDKIEKSKTPQNEKDVDKILKFLNCANINLQGGTSLSSEIDLDKWTRAACVRLHQRGLNAEILGKLDNSIYLFSIKGEKTIEAFPVSRGLRPPPQCEGKYYCVRDRVKTDYFTSESPVTYNPNANMEWADKFVKSTMIDSTGKHDPQLAEFIQDFLGLCLTGMTLDQFLFIFWGEEAGNGKGAIMRTTRKVMGPKRYCAAHKDVYIKAGKTSAGSANPHLAELKGCLLAVGSETDAGEALNLDQVKGLTGEDPVKTRFLYKNLIEFMVTHKSVLLTNNIPTFAMDNGMDRRLIIIGFLAKFKPCICKEQDDNSGCKCPLLPHERIADPTLELKLTSEEGSSAWLNFMLEGLNRRCQTLNLKIPDCVRNLTQQVKDERDSILRWMTATCDVKDPSRIVVENESEIKLSTLYESYCFYCRNRKISKEEQATEHKFGREMFKRYKNHRGTKSTRYAYYVGITIKQQVLD